MPYLVDRWVDEVIADCSDLDDILERLQATIDMMVRQRLDTITGGDQIAERAGDALDALRNRLALLTVAATRNDGATVCLPPLLRAVAKHLVQAHACAKGARKGALCLSIA